MTYSVKINDYEIIAGYKWCVNKFGTDPDNTIWTFRFKNNFLFSNKNVAMWFFGVSVI